MSESSDIKKEASKLELIAKKEVVYSDELYKVVDFLNKNLKNKKVIIGISKNGDMATISIYET
ncbi:YpmA family protein [Tepidanaerobacter syntrophicus]|nr:YpmA family protein [Tepidanaerobacter syntrophicus]